MSDWSVFRTEFRALSDGMYAHVAQAETETLSLAAACPRCRGVLLAQCGVAQPASRAGTAPSSLHCAAMELIDFSPRAPQSTAKARGQAGQDARRVAGRCTRCTPLRVR